MQFFSACKHALKLKVWLNETRNHTHTQMRKFKQSHPAFATLVRFNCIFINSLFDSLIVPMLQTGIWTHIVYGNNYPHLFVFALLCLVNVCKVHIKNALFKVQPNQTTGTDVVLHPLQVRLFFWLCVWLRGIHSTLTHKLTICGMCCKSSALFRSDWCCSFVRCASALFPVRLYVCLI